MINPFADDSAATDSDDRELVRLAKGGNRDALDRLIRRHQGWVYNIVVRMLYWSADAEDVTQEILIKVITKLSTFEQRSSFRTWLYRIAVNHVLNTARSRVEGWHFARYEAALDATPDVDIVDPSPGADWEVVHEETKLSCTSGMLLCFDRRQRLVYILGELFGVSDVVGAELMEISRENFRQLLTRARRDLYSFMNNKCGLVNTANPCRCAKKTKGFIDAGYVDPKNLVFLQPRSRQVRELTRPTYEGLEKLDIAYGELFRKHPFYESRDFVDSLRSLITEPQFKSILEST